MKLIYSSTMVWLPLFSVMQAKYDAWSWLMVTVVYLQLLPLYSYEREVWFQFPNARVKSSSVGTNKVPSSNVVFSGIVTRFMGYFLINFIKVMRVSFAHFIFLIHGNIWLQVWKFLLARLQMLLCVVCSSFPICPHLIAIDKSDLNFERYVMGCRPCVCF